jgi:uncharacterized membrane protein
VETAPRLLAFVAYLLPIIGPLFILLFSRRNLFALYHAYQSLAIVAGAIVVPLLWLIVSWAISWVPLAGAVVGVALFALVISTWVMVVITWIMGMINALQGNYRRLPVFGQWGEKAFLHLTVDEEMTAPQEGQKATV